ncbi:MAG: ABC transporter permease subunit, partial [Mycoplasmatales bacterium]|nr:ABC transporter permease subunit [Mycoplasmatales bacterium]
NSEKKLKNIYLNSNDSFDNKAKIIELKYKIEFSMKAIEIAKVYDKKIDLAIKKYNDLKSTFNKKENKEKENNLIDKLKNEKSKEIERIKNDFNSGKFSKTSKNNSIKTVKKQFKSNILEIKLDNNLSSAKEKVRFFKLDKTKALEKNKNLMFSLIDDSLKNIPTKIFKYQKIISTFSSLILPGTGQILNKQYLKGILLIFLALFAYGFLLPLSMGWISFRGEGIFGLGVLAPSKPSFLGGLVYKDARYRIVEGIIAIFALSFFALILVLSSKDAYSFSKAMQLGLRPKNGRDLKKYFASSGLPYILSFPAALVILLVVILPLATTIFLGFTNYSSGHIPPGNSLDWVGWDNFVKVFSGNYAKSFGFVAIWTLIWTFSVSILVIGLGTFLAFILDQKRIKGKVIFSTIYVLPWAVPAFATILFFAAAFNNGSIYNQLFGTSINFKSSVAWTRMLLILIQVWLGHSYIFLLMTGVKKSISKDLYEAASIDGAPKITQFIKISVPIILFQIMPLLIGQIIFNFNNFGIIWMFSDGGPATSQSLIGNPGSTDIFISLIFKMTTSSANNNVALASAFTIVISLFVVSISAIGFVRSKSFKGEI